MCKTSQFDKTQKEASQATKTLLQTQWASLMENGGQAALDAEMELAARNLLLEAKELVIRADKNDERSPVVWSQKAYRFLDQAAPCCCPATVNPSLFANGKNNHLSGLFGVTDRVFQVRGFDMANLTLVLGDTGWIVLDTLMSRECTEAAVELAERYFQRENDAGRTSPTGKTYPLPIRDNLKAIFISHSHVDHFGGIRGLIGPDSAVPVYAPQGFTRAAVSENVYAGQAMGRRAAYQYGAFLEPGPKGSVAIGIGQGQSSGAVGFHTPVIELDSEAETRFPTDDGRVDGLTVRVQLTPGAEAPAEMNLYFEELNALWMAENCSGTLHNLYTLRGAQVRDGNAWARYLMEALARFGGAQVVFQAHNWPHWNDKKAPTAVRDYIQNTAMAYKYINDQTLLYMNMGYTKEEIAEKLALPDELARNWYLRPYYGTPSHDSKAVYQKYLGWYDANPAHLDPLPPASLADKLLPYLDKDGLLDQAARDYEAGDYRFVAELSNLLLFAGDLEGGLGAEAAARLRGLCADAMEQLGYQAESGPWRNAYLSGAHELRHGAVTDPDKYARQSAELVGAMTGPMLLDYMGILFDGADSASRALSFTFSLRIQDDYDPEGAAPAAPRDYGVSVSQGTILYAAGKPERFSFQAAGTRGRLLQMTTASPEQREQLAKDLTGNAQGQACLTAMMAHFTTLAQYRFFNIVERREGPRA